MSTFKLEFQIMLLEMANKFSFKIVQKILLDEEKYISDVFEKMCVPMVERGKIFLLLAEMPFISFLS